MAETKETVILDFKVDTKSAVVSIENLTKANKALRDERKSLDLSTDAGKAKAAELNAQIDKNTSTIKDNSSALEKQRLNVGNYTGALDKLVPGLGGTINGFLGMTKAAVAFIATPIGLVITAIAVAIQALISYFKSSEEGQNRWNKILLVGKTIVEQLMNFVEALGETLFDAFEHPQESLESFWKMLKANVINRLIGLAELLPKIGEAIGLVFEGKFSEAGVVAANAIGKIALGVEDTVGLVTKLVEQVSDAISIGIEEGKKLADIQAKLDKDERKLIVERAKTNLEVSKKRREAVSQEADQKRATIMEAIALEEALAAKETAHAQLKLDQALLELKANGDDKEAKLKVAEAEATLINAEASRYEATLRFSKEIEKLDDAERARKQKLADDQVKMEQDKQKQITNDLQKVSEDRDKKQEEDNKKIKKAADDEKEIKKQVGLAELAILDKVTGEKTAARSIGTALLKKDSLKEVAIHTKDGAIAAYKSLAGIPIVGPILGAIAAAAVIVYGGIQAAGIAAIGFKKGGYTGDGGSDQVAGVTHGKEFVMPANIVSQYGKEHFQSYMDGSIVANGSTAGIGGGGQAAPIVYLSYKEFTEFSNRVKLKESIVSA